MKRIEEEIINSKTVAVAGHVKPDGDCTGSSLGMYNYIKDNFKDVEVDIYLELVPSAFKFMKNAQNVKTDCSEDKKYDLFIALDCADELRLGDSLKYFKMAKKTICIDHHISNVGFADINFIEPEMSSASELLFKLIDEDKISISAAECIYTGIVHDTGVFQYNCTSPKTMNTAGKLMKKGINFTKIVDETFFKKTFIQNKMLGRALDKAKLYLNGKCIISVITLDDMEQFAAKTEDLEGIVSQLRITTGVEAGILIHESLPDIYKASMRSNGKVDLSVIAVKMGGGGHVMAAGCTLEHNLDDKINTILSMISEQLKD